MTLPSFGKRERFIFLSLALSALHLLHYFLPTSFENFLPLVILLVQVLGIGLIFQLTWRWGDLVYLILPTTFCLGMSCVQVLFPNTSLWFRVVFGVGFFLSFYLILLVLNVFRVAKSKAEIPLVRPARTALFLLTVLAFFLGSSAILKGVPWLSLQILLVFFLALSLTLSFFRFTSAPGSPPLPSIAASLMISGLTTQLLIAMSLMPQKSFFRALSLAAVFYAFLGIGETYFTHRLERRVFWEFSLIFLLGMLLFWLFPK